MVVETGTFTAAAKAAGLSGDDVDRIIDRCAEHPNLTKRERNALAQLTKVLVDSYRVRARRLR